MSSIMPLIFIGHGSPKNAILENNYVKKIKHFGKTLIQNVNTIVCISAHWNTEGVWISGAEKLNTIYDFSGFPEDLYKIKYEPKGNKELALKIKNMLLDYEVSIDEKRGIDHGAWSVLMHLYPDARIPVIQLSLNLNFKTADHYKMAQLLKPLRNEGILFIGSGNIVHSFFSFSPEENAATPDWARDFDNNIKTALKNRDHNSIIRYRRIFGKNAKKSVPTEEHFLPLIYIIGLQEKEENVNFIYEEFQNASMSMLSFIIQ
ncbi:class III extradiol ring-cleavage dioxygenase [Spirobacillus cienkowskii]|jgi:4,5-DOPA dioxygenase extradiol